VVTMNVSNSSSDRLAVAWRSWPATYGALAKLYTGTTGYAQGVGGDSIPTGRQVDSRGKAQAARVLSLWENGGFVCEPRIRRSARTCRKHMGRRDGFYELK
jgi:hypothetical protein